MKRKLVVFLLLSILFSVTLPWVSAAPPGDRPPRPPPDPDPPPPPPQPSIPTIYTPTCISDSATQVTIKVSVGWHCNPYASRYVQIQYKQQGTSSWSTWYMMSPVGGLYQKIISGLDPEKKYDYQIKATEIYFNIALDDYVTLTSTTGVYIINSCALTISVSVPSATIEEKQAVCSWTVTNWGRDGQGAGAVADVWFRHRQDTSPITPYRVSTSTTGQYTMTGLVMDNPYECKVQVTHTVDGHELSSGYSSLVYFDTDDWHPTRKYALIINLNNDVDDTSYSNHQTEMNRINTAVRQTITGASAFDYVHTVHMSSSAEPSDVTDSPTNGGQLTWPAWSADSNYGGSWTPSDSNSFVFIYIVGHGGTRTDPYRHVLCLGDGEYEEDDVSESSIASALNYITYGKMAIVIEACKSGGLINSIGGTDRLVITAADSTHLAWNAGGGCVFSSTLTPELAGQSSFYDAFLEACDDSHIPYHDYQNPLLDDCSGHSGVGEAGLSLDIGSDGQLAYALDLWITKST